jgi:hypothetical protein
MQEEWKDVVGYEDYFKVSNFGRVFGKRSNRILKLNIRSDRRVAISTRIGGRNGQVVTFLVHRLVAEAFIPNPERKLTVNHIDGNPSNNMLENLEWATYKENMQHAVLTGLAVRKKGYKLSKLKKEERNYIKENYKAYSKEFGSRALAGKFNVDHMQILRALKNS